jgi:hypothetical protein
MEPKVPNRMPSGQVDQQGYEPGGIDMQDQNCAQAGGPVPLKIIDGKAGSVESKGLPQTK